jgi:hypothetical protein
MNFLGGDLIWESGESRFSLQGLYLLGLFILSFVGDLSV